MIDRTIISVDLKELADPFRRHCERANLSRWERAAFIRKALQDALGAPAPTKVAKTYEATMGVGSRKWLRASVSPETYDLLLRAMKASGAHSMPEYLAAIAERATPVTVTRAKPSGKGLSPEAMQAISTSNRELMAIGKNINQIARSLHEYPGKMTERDRALLRALPALIRDHADSIAKWLLQNNPPRKRKDGKRSESGIHR